MNRLDTEQVKIHEQEDRPVDNNWAETRIKDRKISKRM